MAKRNSIIIIRSPEIDVSERRECRQDLSNGGPAIRPKIVASLTYCSQQNRRQKRRITLESETS